MTRRMMPRLPALLPAALLVLGTVLVPGAGALARAQTTDPSSGQGGGGKNVVILQNRSNGRLTTRAEIRSTGSPARRPVRSTWHLPPARAPTARASRWPCRLT